MFKLSDFHFAPELQILVALRQGFFEVLETIVESMRVTMFNIGAVWVHYVFFTDGAEVFF
jgi:hypothetical protein